MNEAFARRFFGYKDLVGQRIRLGGSQGDWYSIVGVVRNVRHLPLGVDPPAEVFTSYLQAPAPYMTLIVRTVSDPGSFAAAVRGTVLEVDQNQPVYDVATMQQRLAEAVAPQRFNTIALGIFAGMAVMLSGVGVYGVTAYSVAQRTHEIGVRMALGAQWQDVVGFVLRQVVLLIAFGLGFGVAGALALMHVLSSLLYGVRPTDPLTFIVVSLLLTSIALLASYIPARRATKVDPMVALRHE